MATALRNILLIEHLSYLVEKNISEKYFMRLSKITQYKEIECVIILFFIIYN